MEEIIKIKCPFCGAVLSVKNQPGIESKNVTCPVCNHKYPFAQFGRPGSRPAPAEDEHTHYPEEDEHTITDEDKPSSGGVNYTLGVLVRTDTKTTYPLRPGRNVVGRKCPTTHADIQLETGEGKRLSREHIVIEIKKVPSKGFVHYISLAKEKVNPTYVGDEPLFFGDCVVLSQGDLIKLPDVTLKFMIPDEDLTDF